MLRAFASTKKKHKGVVFLYDDGKEEYIGKIYDIEHQEEIAKAFKTAYNNLDLENKLTPEIRKESQ
jgi:hypothetical protein